MNQFDFSITKEVIKGILKNAENFKWSLQGFGMLRLYLSESVRLHVWDDRYRVKDVSDIHTRPWDFHSTVIAGFITDNVYEFYPGGEEYSYSRMLAGENAHLKGGTMPIELKRSFKLYGENGTYNHSLDDIHNTHYQNGSVTLVARRFFNDRDHASVFWRKGKEWVDARPRPATNEEVKNICGYSLETWFK